ncbi:hypothetical protein MHK_007834 [Candidatus Magnetomorum sp. HK-1]|nr:hypothetical protein MHK_007834 [Candidatus Magnetomorum sp. HK-1]
MTKAMNLRYNMMFDLGISKKDTGVSFIPDFINKNIDKAFSYISKGISDKTTAINKGQTDIMPALRDPASQFWAENAIDCTSTNYLFNNIMQGCQFTRSHPVLTQVTNVFKYPTIMLMHLSRFDHIRKQNSETILGQEFTNDQIHNLEKYMRGFWTRQVSRPTMWKYNTINNFSDGTSSKVDIVSSKPHKIDGGKEYFRITDPEQKKKLGFKIFDNKLTSEFGSFCLSSGINKGEKTVSQNQDYERILLAKAAAISIAQLYQGTRNNEILYHNKKDFTFMWLDPTEKPAIYSFYFKDLIDSSTNNVNYKSILNMVSGKAVEFKFTKTEIDLRVIENLRSMGKKGGYVIGEDLLVKNFDVKIRSLITPRLLEKINRLDEIFSYTLILKEHIQSPKNDPGFCTFGNFARLHTRIEHIYENKSFKHTGNINIHQRFAHQWIDGSPALDIHTILVDSLVDDTGYTIDSVFISDNSQNSDNMSFCAKVTEAATISKWEQKIGRIRKSFMDKGLQKKDVRGISLDIIIMNALMRELDLSCGHFLESYDLTTFQENSEKGISPVIIPTPRFNGNNKNSEKEIKDFSETIINTFTYISKGRFLAKMGMGPVSSMSVLTQKYRTILQNVGMLVSRDVTKMLTEPELMYSRLSQTNANKSAFYSAVSDVYKGSVVVGAMYQNKRTHDDGDTLYLTFDLGPEAKSKLKRLVRNMVKKGNRIQKLINDELEMLEHIGDQA